MYTFSSSSSTSLSIGCVAIWTEVLIEVMRLRTCWKDITFSISTLFLLFFYQRINNEPQHLNKENFHGFESLNLNPNICLKQPLIQIYGILGCSDNFGSWSINLNVMPKKTDYVFSRGKWICFHGIIFGGYIFFWLRTDITKQLFLVVFHIYLLTIVTGIIVTCTTTNLMWSILRWSW